MSDQVVAALGRQIALMREQMDVLEQQNLGMKQFIEKHKQVLMEAENANQEPEVPVGPQGATRPPVKERPEGTGKVPTES